MPCEDWRSVAAGDIEPLYALERDRWLRDLAWDTAATWASVEQGRRAGRLPGFVHRGAGHGVSGWCFISVERGTAHVGLVDGDRADVVRELVDHVLDAPETAYTRRYQAFLYPRTPAVAVALQRRRFAIAPQLLLTRATSGARTGGTLAPPGPPWRTEEVGGLVRLLARAYAGTPLSEAFAPEGRLEEWVAYVGQVLGAPACGTLVPRASIVVPGGSADRPLGAILTTEIARGAWHIVQVATDPQLRRRGLARRLVEFVCASAAEAGAREVTLVVDERNAAARALYDGLGFTLRGELLLASRGRVTRTVTRAAETASVGS
jgi:ribosomal protein S18 acetylase RimI-like enzyme